MKISGYAIILGLIVSVLFLNYRLNQVESYIQTSIAVEDCLSKYTHRQIDNDGYYKCIEAVQNDK